MKWFIVRVVPALLFFCSSVPAFAQEAKNEVWKKEDMWDKDILRQVNLRLDNAKTSDQLLSLAKAAGIDIFADATLFSTSS